MQVQALNVYLSVEAQIVLVMDRLCAHCQATQVALQPFLLVLLADVCLLIFRLRFVLAVFFLGVTVTSVLGLIGNDMAVTEATEES